MGRTTIYRTDVEKARKALIQRGVNPSLDALRIELGNTGSKSTIHKFLREIEAEETADGDQEKMLSNEIADLVTTLAARLKAEAEARVDAIRAASEQGLKASADTLAKEQAETQRLATVVERLEASLGDERAAQAETRDRLQDATVTIGQLEERVLGYEERIRQHESHAKSLETKHEQARDALEHFRTAAKEQREQEQRRHEHQVQGLQLELRQASETIATKNDEVLRLNRDNARLTEQLGQLDKDLRQLRADVREREHELQALRPIAADHKALQTRCAHADQTARGLVEELAAVRVALDEERAARQAAEIERARLTTIDDIVARLSRPADAAEPSSDG